MSELQKDKGGKVKQIKADIVKKKAEVAKLEEAVAALRNDAMTDSIEVGESFFRFLPLCCDNTDAHQPPPIHL